MATREAAKEVVVGGAAATEAVVMVEPVRVVAEVMEAAVEREEAPAPRRSGPSVCSRS